MNFAESLELAPLEDHEDSKLAILRNIWTNYRFRDTLGSLTLFKLPDSALYFLSHFERITSEDFVPCSEDIVRMRRATTGIQVRLGTACYRELFDWVFVFTAACKYLS